MKNAIVSFTIVLLIATSGVLLYLTSYLQTQNSNLQDQRGQLADQTNSLVKTIDIQEKQTIELQNRLSKLETQFSKLSEASNLVITEFTLMRATTTYPNGTTYSTAYVTVQNFGTNGAEGAGVVLNISYVEVSSGLSDFVTLGLGAINAGETKKVNTLVPYFSGTTEFVAALMLDGVVLDDYSLTVQ